MAERANHISAPPPAPRSIWIMLEAPEVIELKRISLDRDGDGAVAFFREILTPRVRTAARQRGIALDLLVEDKK